MESEMSKKELGGTIDSWCGKCKMVLAHTIEAMVGDKPARVHCNTCQAQHTYKPKEPTKSTPGKGRLTRSQTLLKGNTPPKAYSPQDNYKPGDVVQHPTF